MSELSVLDESIINSGVMGESIPQQNQSRNRHGLYVEFYMHPVQDKAASIEENRPIFKEREYIMIMTPGDKSSVVRRPVRIGHNSTDDNNRFHNEYVAFKQKSSSQIVGTLLSEWPQITRAQCMELEHLNVRTVEHLADMPDSYASQYMGLMDMKKKAKAWLEITKSDAPIAKLQDQIDKKELQIASQAQAIEDLQEQLNELRGSKKGGNKKASEE
jgi:hypothetical protein